MKNEKGLFPVGSRPILSEDDLLNIIRGLYNLIQAVTFEDDDGQIHVSYRDCVDLSRKMDMEAIKKAKTLLGAVGR